MRNKVQAYLTAGETKLLLMQPERTSLLGKRDYAIMLTFLSTGIRLAELCALTRSDLKTEGRKVWLYVFGKGGKQRRIPIRSPQLLAAISEYWKKGKVPKELTTPVFLSTSRRPKFAGTAVKPRAVEYLIEKYAAQANLQKHIHVHSLRHTFLTNALRASNDIAAVQKLAGHSNISTTQVYIHTEDEQMERAIQKLQEF